METKLTFEDKTYAGKNLTWKKAGRSAVIGLLTMPDEKKTLRFCVSEVEAMRELEGTQPDEVRLVSLFWPVMEMAGAVYNSKNAGEKSALAQRFLANLLACFGWPMKGAAMTMCKDDTRADAAPLNVANAKTRKELALAFSEMQDNAPRREVPPAIVKDVLEMFRQIGASPTHEECRKMLLRLEVRLSVDQKSLEALKAAQAALVEASDDKARLAAVIKENKAREILDSKSWLPLAHMREGHLARLVKRLALRYDTITPEPRCEIGTDAGRWFSPLNAAAVAGQLKAVGHRVNHAAIVFFWPDTVTALPVSSVELEAVAVALAAGHKKTRRTIQPESGYSNQLIGWLNEVRPGWVKKQKAHRKDISWKTFKRAFADELELRVWSGYTHDQLRGAYDSGKGFRTRTPSED